MSTFLRSLRTGPAPPDVFGGALRGTAAALGCITVDGVLGSCAAALG